jgi:hypothetical protein
LEEPTLAEKKKLRNGFRRFDMICYTVIAVIILNALGAFASNGTQAFTWLVISAINFSLPHGLLVAELGSTAYLIGGHQVTDLHLGPEERQNQDVLLDLRVEPVRKLPHSIPNWE